MAELHLSASERPDLHPERLATRSKPMHFSPLSLLPQTDCQDCSVSLHWWTTGCGCDSTDCYLSIDFVLSIAACQGQRQKRAAAQLSSALVQPSAYWHLHLAVTYLAHHTSPRRACRVARPDSHLEHYCTYICYLLLAQQTQQAKASKQMIVARHLIPAPSLVSHI